MNFSTLRKLTIPEGEVSMIARGSEILWQKQTKKLLRYIKFVVNSVRSVGGTQMQFSEIEFLNASGNRFNYPATTTVTSPDMPATATVEGQNKIIDGLTSTKFCTIKFASGRYLLIDLGEPALDVNEFCVWRWWTGNDNYGRDPMSFELWGSVDGDTYELLDSAVDADVPTARQVVAYTGTIDVKLPSDTRVPADYQEVEYIQSTGTQYIDTGVVINTATDDVEYVFQCTEQNVYKWFYGEHDNNARFGLGSGDGANKRNVAYGNSTYKVTDTQIYNSQHTFTANQSGVFIDEAKIANFASFKSSSTLYLFSLNLNGGNYAAAAKVWSYKHSRNGVLIRDLVPCYRKSDGVAGMFDLVTETFFTNKGTGEFAYLGQE